MILSHPIPRTGRETEMSFFRGLKWGHAQDICPGQRMREQLFRHCPSLSLLERKVISRHAQMGAMTTFHGVAVDEGVAVLRARIAIGNLGSCIFLCAGNIYVLIVTITLMHLLVGRSERIKGLIARSVERVSSFFCPSRFREEKHSGICFRRRGRISS